MKFAMRKPATRKSLVWALRFGFAALFLFAAVPKLLDPATFARGVEGYRLLPQRGVYAVALALPWLEAFVGLALLGVPWLRRGAWALATLMLAVFAVALGSAAARGLDLRCGCFGGGEPVGAGDAVLRALLTALALVGFRLERGGPAEGWRPDDKI
jgi:uncharacterized membrane protein YphA (DoxX/SURF4 family)